MIVKIHMEHKANVKMNVFGQMEVIVIIKPVVIAIKDPEPASIHP